MEKHVDVSVSCLGRTLRVIENPFLETCVRWADRSANNPRETAERQRYFRELLEELFFHAEATRIVAEKTLVEQYDKHVLEKRREVARMIKDCLTDGLHFAGASRKIVQFTESELRNAKRRMTEDEVSNLREAVMEQDGAAFESFYRQCMTEKGEWFTTCFTRLYWFIAACAATIAEWCLGWGLSALGFLMRVGLCLLGALGRTMEWLASLGRPSEPAAPESKGCDGRDACIRGMLERLAGLNTTVGGLVILAGMSPLLRQHGASIGVLEGNVSQFRRDLAAQGMDLVSLRQELAKRGSERAVSVWDLRFRDWEAAQSEKIRAFNETLLETQALLARDYVPRRQFELLFDEFSAFRHQVRDHVPRKDFEEFRAHAMRTPAFQDHGRLSARLATLEFVSNALIAGVATLAAAGAYVMFAPTLPLGLWRVGAQAVTTSISLAAYYGLVIPSLWGSSVDTLVASASSTLATASGYAVTYGFCYIFCLRHPGKLAGEAANKRSGR